MSTAATPTDSPTFADNNHFNLQVSLQRGKVEQVPTDNVTMGSIIGTPDGRVFMAGSDGAVYELLYGRAAQGWFTSSRQKYARASPAFSLFPASYVHIRSPNVKLTHIVRTHHTHMHARALSHTLTHTRMRAHTHAHTLCCRAGIVK